MRQGELVKERYRIGEAIGSGAVGKTYRGRDEESGADVVLKVLCFDDGVGWKQFDSLETEARVLKTLNHPRIPRYRDFFELKDEEKTSFILVQDYVQGRNLFEQVRDGLWLDEEEVRRIASELLSIIAYLGSLSPPIIHRDINPKNVILSDGGDVYLVDFGGVQSSARSESETQVTMFGTPGYTPVEQFAGRASIRSDLYGFAATLAFLLTHKNPAELPAKGMKPDVNASVPAPLGIRMVLENYLEPDEANRTLSIEDAGHLIMATDEEAKEIAGDALLSIFGIDEFKKPPHGSKIVFQRTGEGTTFVIPEGGSVAKGGIQISFGIVWISFIAFWTAMTIIMGAPIIFPIFSIPFWLVGIFLVKKTVESIFTKTIVRITAGSFSITRKTLIFQRNTTVPMEEVGSVRLSAQSSVQWKTSGSSGTQEKPLVIETGAITHTFGGMLSKREKAWLTEAINLYVEKNKSRR
jgi:serine/threonine protein kinase